jgi:hypothetical protein
MKTMRHILIAGAIAAASLSQVGNPAAAQSDVARFSALVALERLAAPPAPAADPVPFTLTAAFNVTGRVLITSPGLAGPLFCQIRIFYDDPNTDQFHAVSAKRPMQVSGKIGTCAIPVPIRWANVTESTEVVDITMEVGNIEDRIAVNAATQPVRREADFPGVTLPLPTQGETVQLNFSTRM